MGDALSWSPWRVLQPELYIDARSFAETLDGGQAFRWQRLSVEATASAHPVFEGIWLNYRVRLRLDVGSRVEWSIPLGMHSMAEGESALSDYLGAQRDFAGMVDNLPWRSDPVLCSAIALHPQLRLLQQPFEETLLGFLCSSNKQIVQIKQMLAHLARKHGTDLGDGIHALPTWSQLAGVTEAELAACALGYRAKYIHGTALRLAADHGFFERVRCLPYPEAKAELVALPGVGAKVADCVLLFGAGCFEAFPVDTWILSIMERSYGLTGWTPMQIAHFGRQHFGAQAGLAQQFLFAKARKEKLG